MIDRCIRCYKPCVGASCYYDGTEKSGTGPFCPSCFEKLKPEWVEYHNEKAAELERLRAIEAAAKRAMGNVLLEIQPHRVWWGKEEWSYVIGEDDGRKLKEALYGKPYPACYHDGETPMLRLTNFGREYEHHPWRKDK